MMDGILNVLKPAGLTSHDVVAKLRKIYHTKKVGHTGTLDPDAVGVLPVCVGQATRLVEYLTEKDKIYRTVLKFGCETNTQDGAGQVTATTALPTLNKAEFCAVAKQFVGEIQQIPPIYSAIKKDGQPLYKLARQGIAVELAPRSVTIHAIKVLMYNQESAMLEIHCGKGTYIRTLCQDLGRACGSSAYMAYLIRTASGAFTIEQAITLERLQQAKQPEVFLMDMNAALSDMPVFTVAVPIVQTRVLNGLAQRVPGVEKIPSGTICRVISAEGQLLAIGTAKGEQFQPNKVFKCGERL